MADILFASSDFATAATNLNAASLYGRLGRHSLLDGGRLRRVLHLPHVRVPPPRPPGLLLLHSPTGAANQNSNAKLCKQVTQKMICCKAKGLNPII